MCHEFSKIPCKIVLRIHTAGPLGKELPSGNEGIVDVLLPDLSVHLVGDYVSQQIRKRSASAATMAQVGSSSSGSKLSLAALPVIHG